MRSTPDILVLCWCCVVVIDSMSDGVRSGVQGRTVSVSLVVPVQDRTDRKGVFASVGEDANVTATRIVIPELKSTVQAVTDSKVKSMELVGGWCGVRDCYMY